jgi:hypothetical protein
VATLRERLITALHPSVLNFRPEAERVADIALELFRRVELDQDALNQGSFEVTLRLRDLQAGKISSRDLARAVWRAMQKRI